MNIYDFRDFRKKWFALQESFAKKQIKDSQVETNNKDGLEIENQQFTEDEVVNWNTPVAPDRAELLNDILDEMINAYEANRKFSDGVRAMDEFIAEAGVTLSPEEENKLFRAYRMVVSGAVTKEELPPPFGTGVAESSLTEARKRKIKEKKKKLQKNSKFKENKYLKKLEKLANNSKYAEADDLEEEDDDMSAIDDVVLNSKYAEADDLEEEDDDMSAIDDVVLNSKYAEADDLEEEDDDMSAIDDVVLNSRHKKKAKKENVTSADVGSGVGKAPDAKIKKEVKKRKIKEAEEFDDPKEMENIEADVDAEMSNQDIETDEGADDSVGNLLDQLKKKFEDKFPGKEILITVKSKDEPIDDEIVSKAKEVTGSSETEGEEEETDNLDKDLENIDSESSDDLEGKVFSKGEEGSLEKEEEKDIKKESYKKTLRALRKIIMEAKEELSDIENEISKDKNEKDAELEDDLENIEKSDDEVDNSEPDEKLDEPTGGSEENVNQNEITLSIDNWKKVLD